MFRAQIDAFLLDCEDRGVKASTRRSYRSMLSVIDGMAETAGITTIDETLVREVVRQMDDKGRKSISAYLATLDLLADHATGRRIVKSARVLFTDHDVRRVFINPDEFRLIYEQAEPHFRVFMVLCAGMGLRLSEAISLRWTDIDGRWATVCGKGHGKGKVVRLFVPDIVMDELHRWQDNLSGVEWTRDAPIVGYVKDGKLQAFSEGSVDKDLVKLSRLMRHANVTTTQVYLHTDLQEMAESMNAASAVLAI